MSINTSYTAVEIPRLAELTAKHGNSKILSQDDYFVVARQIEGKTDTYKTAYKKIRNQLCSEITYQLSTATDDNLGGIRTGFIDNRDLGQFGIKVNEEDSRAFVDLYGFKSVIPCTQEEYDNIEEKDPNTLYCTQDEEKNLQWLNDVYPVGSVYQTTLSSTPDVIFKGFGSWRLLEQTQLGVFVYERVANEISE